MKSAALLLSLVLAGSALAQGPLTREAAHAEALAVIRSGDDDSGGALARLYEVQFGRDQLGGELLLELALLHASRAWPALKEETVEKAASSLRDFLRSHRKHPRAAEAYLAEAELATLVAEPDYDRARNEIRLARGANPTPAILERIDRLALQLALVPESGTDPEAAMEQFLRRWPDSPLVPGVRFDAGTLAWRRGDLAQAGMRWEAIAEEFPGHPLNASALRWAGEAALAAGTAAGAQRALDLFGSAAFLAGSSEPLRGQAERGRIRALLRLGRAAEAGSRAEARLATSWEGETLLLEAKAKLAVAARDPSKRVEAIVEVDTVVADPVLTPPARREMLVTVAELQGLSATDALRDALAIKDPAGLVWRFRAGFLLVERLESERRWEEAAAILSQLASLGGPLAAEARTQLARGRLEHFIWTPEAVALESPAGADR